MKADETPGTPPPTVESSQYKLFATELSQRVWPTPRWTSAGPGTPAAGARRRTRRCGAAPRCTYRYTVIDTIGGGSSEIQKNIIARRGLGLPKNF